MKKIICIAMIFLVSAQMGGIKTMADYNIQMGQRNTDNTAWDNHYPITKADNVLMDDGSTVDSQLASTVKKVNGVAPDIVGNVAIEIPNPDLSSYVTKVEVGTKADKSYVDTITSSIASGSPKGVYETLLSLQTAFPSGATGIYVVKDNGHWYYWNGSTWADGGVYQGIEEDYATVKEILWNAVTENLFNKDTVQNGKITYNGEIMNDASFALSDFIEIEPETSYIVSYASAHFVNFFDKDKIYLSPMVATGYGYVFVTPVGSKYMRINDRVATVPSDKFMVFKGTTLPVQYVPYGKYIDWLSSEILSKNLAEYTNWQGKKIVTFGDSVTWQDGAVYPGSHTEGGIIAIGYQSYMRDALGCTVHNQGYSGLQMPGVMGKIKAYNFTGTDAVTITAGANDFRVSPDKLGAIEPIGSVFDTTTFIGALQESIEYILGANPKIKIFLLTPVMGWNGDGSVMPETYPEAFIDVGKLYAINVCDIYHKCGINSITNTTYIGDVPLAGYYLHPTNSGYKRIADILIPFLKNN